jgi:hypothetical protein
MTKKASDWQRGANGYGSVWASRAEILMLRLARCVLLLLMMVACTSRPRILVSPDSQPIAECAYEAGFLGRDPTFVSLR